jgi:hypothetical protein
VDVAAAPGVPAISSVRLWASVDRGIVADQTFDGAAPTSLGLFVPPDITGPVTVEGQGLDGTGAEVAYGSTMALAVPGKVSEAVMLVLAPGHAPPPDAAAPDASRPERASTDGGGHRLTVVTAGSGMGTVQSTPAGLGCMNGGPVPCAANFPAGQVMLAATPTAPHVFGGWLGACTGIAPTCAVSLDAPKSATAAFHAPPSWARLAGGPRAIGVDANGGVYVAGSFLGTLTVGAMTVKEAGTAVDGGVPPVRGDMFVLKYNSIGELLWLRAFGGAAGNEVPGAIAVLGDGTTIAVAGSFTGTADFSGRLFLTKGLADGFVVTMNGTTGVVVAARAMGGAASDVATSVAFQGATVVVSGFFGGVNGDFGAPAPLANPNMPAAEGFLAKYATAGLSYVWAKAFGGPEADDAADVAADAAGNLFLTGTFRGTAKFDDKVAISLGVSDAYVAKYDGGGVAQWVRGLGGTMADFGTSVALLGTDAVVTGTFVGPVTIGTTTIPGAGGSDVFVARVNAAGDPVWMKGLGSTGADGTAGLAIDSGAVLVGGAFSALLTAPPELAPLQINTAGGNDIFFARLAGTGDLLWVRRFGTVGVERPIGLAADPLGNPVLTGVPGGAFEGLAATAPGFVLKLPRDLRP